MCRFTTVSIYDGIPPSRCLVTFGDSGIGVVAPQVGNLSIYDGFPASRCVAPQVGRQLSEIAWDGNESPACFLPRSSRCLRRELDGDAPGNMNPSGNLQFLQPEEATA